MSNLPSNYLTATETISLVRDGKLTITQIVQDHIKRYEERDSTIHAWAFVDKDLILREASRLDAIPKDQRGPLHGMILGVKDMINTKDMPTQHYSPIYKDHRPNLDAGPVGVCRAAGALIFGKTHTTQFAATTAGPPARNAFDPERTPGGSSAGSGAAVGDWQCHVAFGTQTIGSTIRPGSYNGIFAMKPTWGAIGREGLKILSVTLDTLGLYARSIADLQLLAQVFQLVDDEPVPSPAKPLSGCRFAYIKTDQWSAGSGPSTELERAWSKSKSLLSAAGASITELDLPSEFDGVLPKSIKIMAAEGRVNMLPEYLIAKDKLDPLLISHVENHTKITRREQLELYDSVAALRPKFDELARGYDAIITPSVPGEAWMGTEKTGDARFCGMWTALHVPCVQIPGFASESGMPIGLTLVGPRYEDNRLLSVASQVAKVWVDADDDIIKKTPAPEGARHAVA